MILTSCFNVVVACYYFMRTYYSDLCMIVTLKKDSWKFTDGRHCTGAQLKLLRISVICVLLNCLRFNKKWKLYSCLSLR